jgi:hypothetical protein
VTRQWAKMLDARLQVDLGVQVRLTRRHARYNSKLDSLQSFLKEYISRSKDPIIEVDRRPRATRSPRTYAEYDSVDYHERESPRYLSRGHAQTESGRVQYLRLRDPTSILSPQATAMTVAIPCCPPRYPTHHDGVVGVAQSSMTSLSETRSTNRTPTLDNDGESHL